MERTPRNDILAAALGVAGLTALTVTAVLAAQPAASAPWSLPPPSVAAAAVLDLPSVDAASVVLTADPAVGPDEVAPAPRPSAQWIEDTAAATRIPPAAVRAYGTAALRVADEDPACQLGWTTIAAIGAVESGHGTHDGATLDDDGRPSEPILGPALDGNGVAAIAATPESTAMHGDPRWDHAVGPMQFLPSSWARWGTDGDGDGTVDPHDLDDAALAAARYLCVGERDLGSGDGWRAAVRSYNHSDAYVRDVLGWAETYAAVTRG